MIILDENRKLLHDGDKEPGERIRETLLKNNAMCFYATPDVLYRFSPQGTLFLISVALPKFRAVHLDKWDLYAFKKDKRVATDTALVRDVGGGLSYIYLDDSSFEVPTELLLRTVYGT